METNSIKAKVIRLQAKEQKNIVEVGETFIHDTSKYNWGKLQTLKCGRITSHGHAWAIGETGISTYINHLYFTTDEEIKEGDWYLSFTTSTHGMHVPDLVLKSSTKLHSNKWNRKIVATTDKLKYIVPIFNSYKEEPLPQPSQAFIEKYCKEGGIDEVMIEYNNIQKTINYHKDLWVNDLQIKKDSHNTITIHPVASKEEQALEICKQINSEWCDNWNMVVDFLGADIANKIKKL
jgi:hypothetical protein